MAETNDIKAFQRQFQLDSLKDEKARLQAEGEFRKDADREAELEKRRSLIGRTDADAGQAIGTAAKSGALGGLSQVAEGVSEAYMDENDRMKGLREDYDAGKIGILDMISGFYKGLPGRVAKSYAQGRDTERARQDAAVESFPKTYGAVETLAGAPLELAAGAASKAAPIALGAISSFGNSRQDVVGGEDGNLTRLAGETVAGGLAGKLSQNPWLAAALGGHAFLTGDERDKAAVATGLIPGAAAKLAGRVVGNRLASHEANLAEAMGEAQRKPLARAEKAENSLAGLDIERKNAEADLRKDLEAAHKKATDELELAKAEAQVEVRKKRAGQTATDAAQPHLDTLADLELKQKIELANERAQAAYDAEVERIKAEHKQRSADAEAAHKQKVAQTEADNKRAKAEHAANYAAKLKAFHEEVGRSNDALKVSAEADARLAKQVTDAQEAAKAAKAEADAVRKSVAGSIGQAHQGVHKRWEALSPEERGALSPESRAVGQGVDETYRGHAEEYFKENDPAKVRAQGDERIQAAEAEADRLLAQVAELEAGGGMSREEAISQVLAAQEARRAKKNPFLVDQAGVQSIAKKHGVKLEGEYDPRGQYAIEGLEAPAEAPLPGPFKKSASPKLPEAPPTQDVKAAVARAQAERQLGRIQNGELKQPSLTDEQAAKRVEDFQRNDAGRDTDAFGGSLIDDPWLLKQYERQKQAEAKAAETGRRLNDPEHIKGELARLDSDQETRRKNLGVDLRVAREEADPKRILRQGNVVLDQEPIGLRDSVATLLSLKSPLSAAKGLIGGNKVNLSKPAVRAAYYDRLAERLRSTKSFADRYGKLLSGPTTRSMDRQLAILFEASKYDEELAKKMAEVEAEIAALEKQGTAP